MGLTRRERVRDLCERHGAAWVKSAAQLVDRMTSEQRAGLARSQSEQGYLLARGEPSPHLDPALAAALAGKMSAMEECVAFARANRRLMRHALDEPHPEHAPRAGAMNVLSLCTGKGGIDIGLKTAAPQSRTVCYVEIDRGCQRLLRARMADGALDRAEIHDDLKGRPFQRGAAPRRAQERPAPRPEAAGLAELARDLLRSPRVLRAVRRRWERGQMTAQELKLVADLAAQERWREAAAREAERAEALAQVGRLTRAEGRMWRALHRKMTGAADAVEVGGHRWALVRTPGSRAGAEVPAYVPTEPAPPEEPDLDADLPLAGASRRLRALPAPPPRRPLLEAGPRTPAPPVVEVIVTEPERDAGDASNRAECRRCRRAWLGLP